MLTLAALDPGFLADALNPFIAARRRISGLAGLEVHKPPRVNIISPAKQRAKEGDLGGGSGVMMNTGARFHRSVPEGGWFSGSG
jgi:hypothetical protein